MKISQVIGLGLIALGIAAAVNAAEYAPAAPPATHDTTWTPADADRPVDVDAQQSRTNTIEVAPVVIVAKAPRRAVRQNAQCGAFTFRALEQGSGNVRGFCGGSL